jgi:hypothetical protein
MTGRLPPQESSPHEFWDQGGYWLGPHDLRFFLRHNRGFVPIYMVLSTAFFGVPMWAFVPHVLAPLATLALAAVFTYLFAWLHSRGWIGQGDGDGDA